MFWVYAANATRFEQSYRDIADRVKIPGRRDPNANIFKLVHDWLCDSEGRWLLILDNVDDPRFLLESQGLAASSRNAPRPLREYLPNCEHGSILITTRNREAALTLVKRRGIITIDPIDEALALALFEKKLGAQGKSIHAAELAATLEYMPLAIAHAAAYISQRAPGYSVRRYLRDFKKSERKKTRLLNHNRGNLCQDWESKDSIMTTWEISFQYIYDNRPSAADLLSFMSFFDRQGIPKALLRKRARRRSAQRRRKEHSDRSQSSAIEDEFEYDVIALRNFSFISVDTDGASFKMHALVQLAMRKWLHANSELERFKQQFISHLCAEFPTGKYENWPRCQTLFPHAKSAAGQRPEWEFSLLQWATLLYNAAWYAKDVGNLVDAKELAVKSLKVRRAELGQQHEETLDCMTILGEVYESRGQIKGAEELFTQVMETGKRKLGARHPTTLSSMHHLASTYSEQGRWGDAEELLMRVIEIKKKTLGADHPITLDSMNNLAVIYMNQGRWDDAEKLLVRVIEIRKKKLGAAHPDTLISMGNLASVYMHQHRWEAEELSVQVIEMGKKKLGADHPSTLTSMNNLASTYMHQERWEEAEELSVQVIEMSKNKLGADHPNTLISISNLALIYMRQERWEDAEELSVQVIEMKKKKLGADHPNTLISMNNLASTYMRQERWEEAEELLLGIVKTRIKKLGNKHPYTLDSIDNLRRTSKALGRYGRTIQR